MENEQYFVIIKEKGSKWEMFSGFLEDKEMAETIFFEAASIYEKAKLCSVLY